MRGEIGMFLLKGILIGLIIGVPAGAVGALCVQRSLLYGAKSGLVSGLGSSTADCLYAAVGAFGLTLISDFLTKYQTAIYIIGGLLILFMGISSLLKKRVKCTEAETRMSYPAMFISSLGVGITNPAAVITFLFAFSYLGIDGKQGFWNGAALVLGVLLGTLIWWLILAAVADIIKKRHDDKGVDKLNVVFGVVMICFSVIVFAKGLLGR